MEIKVLTNIDDNFRTQWENFVLEHPNGNFFQSPAAYEFFKNVDGYEPLLITAAKENEIKGILSAVIIKEAGLKGFFSRRCIVWGGPLAQKNDTEINLLLLNKLIEYNSDRIIYSEFRPVSYYNVFEIAAPCFLINEKRYNVLIDLTKSEEQLFKDLHSTRRRQVQRGYRRGIVVDNYFEVNENILKECYLILANVYKKIKLPYPTLLFFIKANNVFNEIFHVFVAKFNDKVVGFRFVLVYKDLIYDWYAASNKDHYDKYPNDILTWEVIKWGHENGYNTFDFGGAGKIDEKYGVRDFKIKFGGKLISTNRYKILHRPIQYQIGKLGLKILKIVK